MKNKGFTLIELLIVVAIIAILAAIAIPNFLQAQVRAKVARAQADMRSIATAIETFYVDSNNYPEFQASTDDKGIESSVIYGLPQAAGYYATFKGGNSGSCLTTPVAYMSSLPQDGFTADGALTFRYCTRKSGDQGTGTEYAAKGTGWILCSNGPDLKKNIVLFDESDSSTTCEYYGAASIDLLVDDSNDSEDYGVSVAEQKYDPTNGTTTPGDIIRIRQ